VQTENLGGVLFFHNVASSASPMVHIRRTERPEIILFGNEFPLKTPFAISTGDVLIKSHGSQVKIIRFALGRDDVEQSCAADLAEVIKGIVAVGGSYPDIVAAIVQAKEQSYLDSRVKFDALPRSGRSFKRDEAVAPLVQLPVDDTPQPFAPEQADGIVKSGNSNEPLPDLPDETGRASR
jgi:hypothetical protein